MKHTYCNFEEVIHNVGLLGFKPPNTIQKYPFSVLTLSLIKKFYGLFIVFLKYQNGHNTN